MDAFESMWETWNDIDRLHVLTLVEDQHHCIYLRIQHLENSSRNEECGRVDLSKITAWNDQTPVVFMNETYSLESFKHRYLQYICDKYHVTIEEDEAYIVEVKFFLTSVFYPLPLTLSLVAKYLHYWSHVPMMVPRLVKVYDMIANEQVDMSALKIG